MIIQGVDGLLSCCAVSELLVPCHVLAEPLAARFVSQESFCSAVADIERIAGRLRHVPAAASQGQSHGVTSETRGLTSRASRPANPAGPIWSGSMATGRPDVTQVAH